MISMDFLQFIIPVAKASEEAASSGGIAATFGIDWMKFIAQLVNFVVILFILWKWVFTPVTKKLEERTARIEKAMKDASNTEKEKQEFSLWREKETSKARVEASAIINSAQTEAIKAKDAVLKQAEEEQFKIVDSAKKQIEQEKNQQLQAAKGELADLITSATEKILREKLTSDKDQKFIKDSLKELK